MSITRLLKLRAAVLKSPPARTRLTEAEFATYLTFTALLMGGQSDRSGEEDARPLLALRLGIDAQTAEALSHPGATRKFTAHGIADVLDHLIATGEVNWFPPAAEAGTTPQSPPTPDRSLPMRAETAYSGRPPQPLTLLVILGHQATAAYEDGERDEQVLAALGTVRRHTFNTVSELNAYTQGVEDTAGYQRFVIVEE